MTENRLRYFVDGVMNPDAVTDEQVAALMIKQIKDLISDNGTLEFFFEVGNADGLRFGVALGFADQPSDENIARLVDAVIRRAYEKMKDFGI